jgi:hypothetical protein
MKYGIICMTCKIATGYQFNTTEEAERIAKQHIRNSELHPENEVNHKVLVAYLVK